MLKENDKVLVYLDDIEKWKEYTINNSYLKTRV